MTSQRFSKLCHTTEYRFLQNKSNIFSTLIGIFYYLVGLPIRNQRFCDLTKVKTMIQILWVFLLPRHLSSICQWPSFVFLFAFFTHFCWLLSTVHSSPVDNVQSYSTGTFLKIPSYIKFLLHIITLQICD